MEFLKLLPLLLLLGCVHKDTPPVVPPKPVMKTYCAKLMDQIGPDGVRHHVAFPIDCKDINDPEWAKKYGVEIK